MTAISDRLGQLLAREDWRYFAIGPGGTGLACLATTERLPGGVVGFALPSAPALFLSMAFAAHRRRTALRVADLFVDHPPEEGGDTYPDGHAPLFDYFEAAMAEIVNSYSAIEATVNEVIPAEFLYRRSVGGGRVPEELTRDEIERRVPLDAKLKKVIPQAFGARSPAGERVWPPYIAPQRLRDRADPPEISGQQGEWTRG